jgi:hypothetical protein
MLEAWKLDGGANASPLALYWKKDFGRTWEYRFIDPPHHINSRDNTGKYDSVEWLITLNRLEHNLVEYGCKPLHLTGTEYMYLVLWLLKATPTDRWSKARKLLETKISEGRIEEIKRVGRGLQRTK